MSFDPETINELPQSVPVFPLEGVLLLPRGQLPLNIFEPRYLQMFEDALAKVLSGETSPAEAWRARA